MPTLTIVDTTSTQTMTNKTLTAPTITAGVVALAAAPTATLDAATKGYVDGLNINPILNGSLAATVTSNNLTLSLKTASGAAPASSDPVRVTFRQATDTDGSLVTRTVTTATSMTFFNGSSVGMTNAVGTRLWVGLLDNAGTVEVCAWNPRNSSFSLKAFLPNTDVTTTAEGSGTATSAHTLYSTNARTSVPFVLLGLVEITEATAGTWATAPTQVLTYRDGMRKTGDTAQHLLTKTGEVATGTTTLPNDDTIPQSNEGDQYMSLAITPLNALNVLVVNAVGLVAYGGSSTNMGGAVFQDAAASTVASVIISTGGADHSTTLFIEHVQLTGTTSSTTFKWRAGSNDAGTTTFNGRASARRFGGTLGSYLSLKELYV